MLTVAVVVASNARPSRGFKRYSPYPGPRYNGYAYAYVRQRAAKTNNFVATF